MLRSRFLVIGLLGIAFATMLYLENYRGTPPETATHTNDKEKIDYQINTFSFKTFNPDGSISQHLNGDALTHFPNQQTYVVKAPNGIVFNPSTRPVWKMTAQKLVANDRFTELRWKHNVTLEQYNDDDSRVSLTTQAMFHDMSNERLSSDSAIVVKEWDASGTPLDRQLSAAQFSIDMKTEELLLQGNVRAQYE
jgi:LPS export ABC transporter protein LptC